MAIFLTGDTHGDFSRFRPDIFYEQIGLTKNDCTIICPVRLRQPRKL